MVERFCPTTPSGPEENLLLDRKEITFLNTGCVLLNCVIGGPRGGWPFGRVVNIVGDKSTGKTLLAEEAIANLLIEYPQSKAYYRECESAFDKSYAKALGVNLDKVDFGPEGIDTHWDTIEDVVEDLIGILDRFDKLVAEKIAKLKLLKVNKKQKIDILRAQAIKTIPPTIYIIDSLDGLSDRAEMKRSLDTGSYNLAKPKMMSAFFRQEVRRIKRSNICLIVISQIRDRIGPVIRGDKYTRAGGRALDFYASAVIFLAHLGKIKETHKGIQRVVGVRIKAQAKKNKIVSPFRECEFDIVFGYGIDDLWSCLDYLKSVNKLGSLGLRELPNNLDGIEPERIREVTRKTYVEIEKMFEPTKGKYA
jgi:recombination protein RecA